jgi:hypothetical protein
MINVLQKYRYRRQAISQDAQEWLKGIETMIDIKFLYRYRSFRVPTGSSASSEKHERLYSSQFQDCPLPSRIHPGPTSIF